MPKIRPPLHHRANATRSDRLPADDRRAKVSLETIPIAQLREAAQAWRLEDVRPSWTGLRVIEHNKSLHDRIDDLVDEVERLREKSVGSTRPAPGCCRHQGKVSRRGKARGEGADGADAGRKEDG